jgi:aminoglycoside 3-N-acetyltransferase I
MNDNTMRMMNPNAKTSVTIRQLGTEDAEILYSMLDMFADAFDDTAQYTSNPPNAAYLRRLLSRDHFIGLCALIDSQVVGGLVAYELMKFEQARSEIYIYDLAVAEPYRRRGIATSLIEGLRQIAMQRGAWVVYVQADYGDDPAVALYSKLGRREDVMHFDIPVSDHCAKSPVNSGRKSAS